MENKHVLPFAALGEEDKKKFIEDKLNNTGLDFEAGTNHKKYEDLLGDPSVWTLTEPYINESAYRAILEEHDIRYLSEGDRYLILNSDMGTLTEVFEKITKELDIRKAEEEKEAEGTELSEGEEETSELNKGKAKKGREAAQKYKEQLLEGEEKEHEETPEEKAARERKELEDCVKDEIKEFYDKLNSNIEKEEERQKKSNDYNKNLYEQFRKYESENTRRLNEESQLESDRQQKQDILGAEQRYAENMMQKAVEEQYEALRRQAEEQAIKRTLDEVRRRREDESYQDAKVQYLENHPAVSSAMSTAAMSEAQELERFIEISDAIEHNYEYIRGGNENYQTYSAQMLYLEEQKSRVQNEQAELQRQQQSILEQQAETARQQREQELRQEEKKLQQTSAAAGTEAGASASASNDAAVLQAKIDELNRLQVENEARQKTLLDQQYAIAQQAQAAALQYIEATNRPLPSVSYVSQDNHPVSEQQAETSSPVSSVSASTQNQTASSESQSPAFTVSHPTAADDAYREYRATVDILTERRDQLSQRQEELLKTQEKQNKRFDSLKHEEAGLIREEEKRSQQSEAFRETFGFTSTPEINQGEAEKRSAEIKVQISNLKKEQEKTAFQLSSIESLRNSISDQIHDATYQYIASALPKSFNVQSREMAPNQESAVLYKDMHGGRSFSDMDAKKEKLTEAGDGFNASSFSKKNAGSTRLEGKDTGPSFSINGSKEDKINIEKRNLFKVEGVDSNNRFKNGVVSFVDQGIYEDNVSKHFRRTFGDSGSIDMFNMFTSLGKNTYLKQMGNTIRESFTDEQLQILNSVAKAKGLGELRLDTPDEIKTSIETLRRLQEDTHMVSVSNLTVTGTSHDKFLSMDDAYNVPKTAEGLRIQKEKAKLVNKDGKYVEKTVGRYSTDYGMNALEKSPKFGRDFIKKNGITEGKMRDAMGSLNKVTKQIGTAKDVLHNMSTASGSFMSHMLKIMGEDDPTYAELKAAYARKNTIKMGVDIVDRGYGRLLEHRISKLSDRLKKLELEGKNGHYYANSPFHTKKELSPSEFRKKYLDKLKKRNAKLNARYEKLNKFRKRREKMKSPLKKFRDKHVKLIKAGIKRKLRNTAAGKLAGKVAMKLASTAAAKAIAGAAAFAAGVAAQIAAWASGVAEVIAGALLAYIAFAIKVSIRFGIIGFALVLIITFFSGEGPGSEPEIEKSTMGLVYYQLEKMEVKWIVNLAQNDQLTDTPPEASSLNFTDNSSVESDQSGEGGSNIGLNGYFEEASQETGVPINLLKAVAKNESSYDPTVVSDAGACGIMQLMPEFAPAYGVTDIFDPRQNILGGARMLAGQLQTFDGDVELALAAYNTGASTVKKNGNKVPSYCQDYVTSVMTDAGEVNQNLDLNQYVNLNMPDSEVSAEGLVKGPEPWPGAPEEAYKWIKYLDGGIDLEFQSRDGQYGYDSNIMEITTMTMMANEQRDDPDNGYEGPDLTDDAPGILDTINNAFTFIWTAAKNALFKAIPPLADFWQALASNYRSKIFMVYAKPLFDMSHQQEFRMKMAIRPTLRTFDGDAIISMEDARSYKDTFFKTRDNGTVKATTANRSGKVGGGLPVELYMITMGEQSGCGGSTYKENERYGIVGFDADKDLKEFIKFAYNVQPYNYKAFKKMKYWSSFTLRKKPDVENALREADQKDHQAYLNLQLSYLNVKYYDNTQKALDKVGMNLTGRSPAVSAAILAMNRDCGDQTQLLRKNLKSSMSDSEIINKIYELRKSGAAGGTTDSAILDSSKALALDMLNNKLSVTDSKDYGNGVRWGGDHFGDVQSEINIDIKDSYQAQEKYLEDYYGEQVLCNSNESQSVPVSDHDEHNGYGCMSFSKFSYDNARDDDTLYYNGQAVSQAEPAAKLGDETACVAPKATGSKPEDFYTALDANPRCWTITFDQSYSNRDGNYEFDSEDPRSTVIDGLDSSAEYYSISGSPDKFTIDIVTSNDDDDDEHDGKIYIAEHTCAGTHTGYYCGGHLSGTMTGVTTGFTAEEMKGDRTTYKGKDELGMTWKSGGENDMKVDKEACLKAIDLFEIDMNITHAKDTFNEHFGELGGWTKDNMDEAVTAVLKKDDWYDYYNITPRKSIDEILKENNVDIGSKSYDSFAMGEYDDNIDVSALSIPNLTAHPECIPVVYMPQGSTGPWGSVKYGTTDDGNPDNIAYKGCGIVSSAMVMTYLKSGSDISDRSNVITPTDILQQIAEHYPNSRPPYNGLYTPKSGTNSEAINKIASWNGFKCEMLSTGFGYKDKEKVIKHLKNKNPIILSVSGKKNGAKYGKFTRGGHYIVVTGVTNDGRFTVNDPSHPDFSKTTFDWDVLSGDAKRWYFLSKL